MKKRLLQLTIITSTLTILFTGCANEKQEPAKDRVADATADFKGSIDIDIRKSKSDWVWLYLFILNLSSIIYQSDLPC